MIADILLAAGALGAAFYCIVLSRRLRRFSDLENGVGGAIAALSKQVEDMSLALGAAQTSAVDSSSRLESLTGRAEDVAARLELLVASMHDIPTPGAIAGDTRAPSTEAPLFLTRRAAPLEAAE
jgi:hypothetical protein